MEKISRVAQAEEDIKYATRFMKPILTIVGAWPVPSHYPLSSKIVQKMTQVFTYFLFFLMLIPPFLYVIKKETNNKFRLRLMGPIINCVLQVPKYTIILYRAKEIQKGIDAIRQDWIAATEDNRLIFLEKARIGRKIVLVVASTMYGGGVSYRILLPLLKGTIVTPDNITIRPLPCPVYFSFLDEQVTPNYEILFLLQIMGGFATYAVISGSCGISALLVLHACSLLRILDNKMKQFSDKEHTTEREVQRDIADVVEFHIKVKRFLKNIKKITVYVYLNDMIGGTGLICLEGYYILQALDDGNTTAFIIYLTIEISVTFCVFILCFIGQLLIDESEVLGLTSCTLNWYRLQPRQARTLILIIVMSNYPMKLTAGKMLEMSLATFTDVFKLSMAYLNILREVV
ncbi:odorant receptor 4-like isoform X2 [Ceratina calcarata]|uniref:Odorant receptor n=1 Tax=Ceratina calcarata TaxID=156304 RepID=A0AAJ7RZV9_9HYME|nr:odorant receptor 4-like isoform X2 [Ceratina calcarata]